MMLLVTPFIFVAAQWDKFPSRIPIHWNLHGRIDGWASRSLGLLLLPVANALVWALLRFLPRIDPKMRLARGGETGQSARQLGIVRVAMLAFMAGMFWAQMAIARGYPVRMDWFALNGCLILLMVVGNYMGNLRPNYFVGIRTPWTLRNNDTWRATHRAGGRIMVFGSVGILGIQAFVPRQAFTYTAVAFLVGFAGWAWGYSWNHQRHTGWPGGHTR